MATNKFLEFNTSKENMQTDEEYSSETQRLNGVSGIAKARMHNKLFRQLSVMAAAIGEFIKSAGNDASDTDVDTLVTAISNSFASKTSVDQKSISQTAGGTATAITLSGISLINGFTVTFVVAANNNGAATTINGMPLYKPGGTAAPKLIAGKAVTVWYDVGSGGRFFIKASASGSAVAAHVLAPETFSNDDDTDIPGAMPNNGPASAETINLTTEGAEYTIPKGYHSGLRKIKAVISGLIASVIKSGTTVGGVLGTFTSDATATAAQMISGVTAYVNGNKVTGAMPDQGAKVITPGTANQAISAGYHNGSGYVVGDPNLISANILNTANIFGVQGAAQTGKKFASGTTAIIAPSLPFITAMGGTQHCYYININGLSFIPSFIMIYFTISASSVQAVYGLGGIVRISEHATNGQGTSYVQIRGNEGNAYVNLGSIRVPVHTYQSGINCSWYAYE